MAKKTLCPACGGDMKRNGTTSSGRTRWRCKACGASTTQQYDSKQKWLEKFIRWLLGKNSQSELDTAGRTFRKHTAGFWKLWPILPICDEIHHVVYMDGIWLTRKCVILIACTDDYVIGCHLARSENSKDWACLMQRIAPPDVLVCDGGGGIETARRAVWPKTKVQRCTFHVFCQVKRCTTSRPKLQAGVELYGIARDLMSIKIQNEAAAWLLRFSEWCTKWHEFLLERAIIDGRTQYKHKRLRQARRALERLCHEGTLFTHLEKDVVKGGPVPAMSNKIENLNGQIRRMLVLHRGMNIDHRIKAVFWFCYMKSEAPRPFSELTDLLPTDEQVLEWRRQAAKARGIEDGPARWGEGVVWAEFHHNTPYPFAID